MCSGDWDYKTGKQMSADYCIPMKNGDCYNNCHVSCCEESQLCPGGDYNGCPQPDFCYPKDGKLFLVNNFWTFINHDKSLIFFQWNVQNTNPDPNPDLGF